MFLHLKKNWEGLLRSKQMGTLLLVGAQELGPQHWWGRMYQLQNITTVLPLQIAIASNDDPLPLQCVL